MKKVLCVLLSVVCLFSLSSCSVVEYFSADMGDLEWTEDTTSDHGALVYLGQKYYYNGWMNVYNQSNDEIIELGSSLAFPFPNHYYYVFTNDDPLYIFTNNGDSTTMFYLGVYFKEGFEPEEQVYIIQDTDIEVDFFKSITYCNKEITAEYESNNTIYLRMKSDTRLGFDILSTVKCGDDWYFIKDGEYWKLDRDFANELIENNIIVNPSE